METNIGKAYKECHHAIHDPEAVGVWIDNVYHAIRRNKKKNLRFIIYNNRMVIQQNPNTNSRYAERARRGERISWVIGNNGYENMIED